MSRELDIKVAEILGWSDIKYWKGMPPGWKSCPVSVSCYSTDYAALPEMLKHLWSLGYEVAIWTETNGHTLAAARKPADVPFTTFTEFDGDVDAQGFTIPEAVARLVVAVAEAQR